MDLQALRQKLGALCDQQQVIVNKAVTEERGMTEEEQTQFNDLQKQIDGLSETIKTAEDMQTRDAVLNKPEEPVFKPGFAPGEPSRSNKKLDDSGFKNIGEFVDAIRFGDHAGRLKEVKKDENGAYEVPEAYRAAILPRISNEWSMGTGSEGGFAVPEQFRQDILIIRPETAIVRPRATVIPAGEPPDSKITIPSFHQGANGVWGGVEVHWTEEGGEIKETSGSLQDVSLEPHEVSALTVVTDKLLRNWQAANAFLTFLLRGAMMSTEDLVFIKGNGVGKPIGMISGDGAIVVNRAIANQIKFVDVAMMLAKLPSESQSNAVWVANQSAMPQLMTMKDDAGNYIFIRGDATRGIPDTLAGIPIRFTGKTYALGTKGDLILVDLQYYLIKDGSGPFISASEHVYFKNNKTVIKVFWNVDGKGWVVEPLTLEDGSTQVSPYVVLDVPQG